jgi:DinB superfamily
MSDSRIDLLQWQFDLTWSLLELHLAELKDEDFRWEPTPYCWTVRQRTDGTWVPDWAESEPDPIPVPTIAWLTWHIGWWWSTAIDHARGRTPQDREKITWPGDGPATTDWLRALREEWQAVLTTADLETTALFPWQNDPDKTVGHMASWVNSELMKNAAEIGQLRLLRAAR